MPRRRKSAVRTTSSTTTSRRDQKVARVPATPWDLRSEDVVGAESEYKEVPAEVSQMLTALRFLRPKRKTCARVAEFGGEDESGKESEKMKEKMLIER